jgi:replicative DNA helicase
MALHIALREKKPIGFFSLEMSKEELVDRLLVGQADIDAWKLKTGKLSDEDYTRLTQAMGELSEAPIFIDDTPGLSILEMRTKARKLTIERGLKMIVVDYLQLATPGKRLESRVQEVSFISQSLKNIARELRIPVIALSQLSRAIEHRGEKKPQLADLRESGSIEQDADIVMFLYGDDDNDELMDQSKRMMKLLIAKHRNGPTGEIELVFRGDRVRFFGVDTVGGI